VSSCICDWPTDCGGLGAICCEGCGGDICVCRCGGEMACPGCEYCDGAEEDYFDTHEEAEL
jgi:hypothetical protein